MAKRKVALVLSKFGRELSHFDLKNYGQNNSNLSNCHRILIKFESFVEGDNFHVVSEMDQTMNLESPRTFTKDETSPPQDAMTMKLGDLFHTGMLGIWDTRYG